MSVRLNGRQFVPWKKRGWKLRDRTSPVGGGLYVVEAHAPDCSRYRLDLMVDESTVFAVHLMAAPPPPRRKWERRLDLELRLDWEKIPAPWFRLKIEQLLQEV